MSDELGRALTRIDQLATENERLRAALANIGTLQQSEPQPTQWTADRSLGWGPGPYGSPETWIVFREGGNHKAKISEQRLIAEIERLQALVAEAGGTIMKLDSLVFAKDDEIERLRTALTFCQAFRRRGKRTMTLTDRVRAAIEAEFYRSCEPDVFRRCAEAALDVIRETHLIELYPSTDALHLLMDRCEIETLYSPNKRPRDMYATKKREES